MGQYWLVSSHLFMGRSRTISNEQILKAAREVFLAKGFGGSTLEIARRAGVSEGSIFKLFSTKEKLFFAAIGADDMLNWVKELKTLPAQGDLKENLVMLSLQIIELLLDLMPRLIMMHSKGLPPANLKGFPVHLPGFVEPPQPPLIRDLKVVTLFFQHELELGRIRPCDPEMAASTLLSWLTHYILSRHTMGESSQSDQQQDDMQQHVRGFIDFFWQGIAPI
jgi:AcrR family transcriptional regulator